MFVKLGIGAGTAIHFATLKCRLALVGRCVLMGKLIIFANMCDMYISIPFNRNEAALKQVAESCKEKGSPDVQFFVKDLIDAEACRATVEDAVAHFGGTEIFLMFRLSKQVCTLYTYSFSF